MSSRTQSFFEHLRPWIPRAATLVLAFGSSVGIYHFSLLFYSVEVSRIIAGSFDGAYLGLAVIEARFDNPNLRKEAINVARTACATAMIMVTLAGLFHLRPELLIDKPLWGDVVLSLVHGVPLSYLAYKMSRLILHEMPRHKDTQATEQEEYVSVFVPQVSEAQPVLAAIEIQEPTQTAQITAQTEEAPQSPQSRIKQRTLDIVNLWNDGLNQVDIAGKMNITYQAVQYHIKTAQRAGLQVRQGD